MGAVRRSWCVDRDVRAWIERAEEDLAAGRHAPSGGHYSHAAFVAHQAAEKALKALHLSRGNALRKTHDLLQLAQQLEAPAAVLQACDVLNPHYIESRDPTGLEDKYDRSDGEEAMTATMEVLSWTKSLL